MLTVQTDMIHQLENAFIALRLRAAELVYIERLADDVGDRHARVQRRIGILEDHRRLLAELLNIRLGLDFLAVEDDFSRRRLVEVQNGSADRGLAAAGLADKPERLALADREGHAVNRLERLRLEHAHRNIEVLL